MELYCWLFKEQGASICCTRRKQNGTRHLLSHVCRYHNNILELYEAAIEEEQEFGPDCDLLVFFNHMHHLFCC